MGKKEIVNSVTKYIKKLFSSIASIFLKIPALIFLLYSIYKMIKRFKAYYKVDETKLTNAEQRVTHRILKSQYLGKSIGYAIRIILFFVLPHSTRRRRMKKK